MWKTGGVTYGHTVDNLSGAVEEPPKGWVSGHYSKLRIPSLFHQNMLMTELNEPKTSKDTTYHPKSSYRAAFREVIVNIRF